MEVGRKLKNDKNNFLQNLPGVIAGSVLQVFYQSYGSDHIEVGGDEVVEAIQRVEVNVGRQPCQLVQYPVLRHVDGAAVGVDGQEGVVETVNHGGSQGSGTRRDVMIITTTTIKYNDDIAGGH